jgi:hypothetical protein
MTQSEFAFWREAVLAALHGPGDAVKRAEAALSQYRIHKSEAEEAHKHSGDKLPKPSKIAVPQSGKVELV